MWHGLVIIHAGIRVGNRVEDQARGMETRDMIIQDPSVIVHGTVHVNVGMGLGDNQPSTEDGSCGFDKAGGVIGRGPAG